MAPIGRRVRAMLCALVIGLATLGLAPGSATAEPLPPGTVTGTLKTADGQPWSTPVLVHLFSWDPDGTLYPTPQDSFFVEVGADGQYSLEAPLPGLYTIRARPAGGGAGYLTTWLGGAETTPVTPADAGSIFVDEQLTPQTGHDVTLRKAVKISGVVRGANGQPLADVTVDARRWVDGAIEPIPSTPGSITDSEGRYSLGFASGTAASLVVTSRAGYRPFTFGGPHDTQSAANTIQLGTDDVTQDIALTPDWTNVGSNGRVVRDEKCLVNALSGDVDLDGLELHVASRGLIYPASVSDDPDDPLDPSSPVPALVPYWSDTARQLTWGRIDDSTLCAIWRSEVDHMAYQVLLTRDGDVTFNYGSIGPNLYNRDAQAGWTEGTTDDATQVDLPKNGYDGFADGAATALTKGPVGSATPGRYRFTYTGFLEDLPPAASSSDSPVVTPTVREGGKPLQVSTGGWDVDGGDPSDLTFAYQWMKGWVPIPDAVGPTYTPPRSADPEAYQVRVVARRPGHQQVLRDVELSVRGTAPTAAPPAISGSRLVGSTLTVAKPAWSADVETPTLQWFRGGIPVVGATGPTYRVGAADLGRTVSVLQETSPEDRSPGRVLSTVAIPPDRTSTRLGLSGKRVTGKRLTATIVVRGTRVVPGGRVEIKDGSKVIARGTLDRTGTARIKLPKLSKGSHRLTAIYPGWQRVARSTSPSTKVTIRSR